MPNPGISKEDVIRRRDAYEAALADGYYPYGQPDNFAHGAAVAEAQRRVGMPVGSTLAWLNATIKWLEYHEERPINKDLYKRPSPKVIDYEPPRGSDGPRGTVIIKPVYRIAQRGAVGSSRTRIVAIGDAHDGPNIEKDRFRWFGKYVSQHKPDAVVQIGDMFSFDSLCRYDQNDTIRGKQKPTFKEDIASAKVALRYFNDGLGNYKVEKHVTLGNHEDRLWSFMNRTPEIAEMLSDTVYTVLTDAGWDYSPFGYLHFISGVAFTHSPLNGMGKPYGGMYSHNQIARDSLSDLVYGHTHKRVDISYPKLNEQKIRILNLGCALPDSHMEPYAKHSLTGWSYGIYDIIVANGHIEDANWVPMATLAAAYGEK